MKLVQAIPFLEAEEKKTPRLSDADIERADAMADDVARRSWRASRIATRILIERVGGADFQRAPFEIEPGGRPVLVGGPQFSVSHTAGVALIAISKEVPVGVDIEARTRPLRMSLDRRKRIADAAGRYAPPLQLSASSEADVLTAWVLLEAAAKARGIGIGRLLTEEGVVGGSKTASAKSPPHRLATKLLSVEGGYVAAIAAERLPDALELRRFPHGEIDAIAPG